MNQIASISEFLLQAGTEYRVFDMGRTIRKVSSQHFLDLENGLQAPAYPRAQHAWFGLVFWNKQLSNQHYIWFVKLPLDEQGMIIPASRNHFLQIIVDALGIQLEQAESKQGQLPENPYSFVPNQQQLADFNSISRRHLKLGHSEHYQAALAYLQTPEQVTWQTVPLQGLADLAASISERDTQQLLVQQFPKLAQEVKFSLLISLENQPVEIKSAEVIAEYLQSHINEPLVWQHGLRALSQSPCRGLVDNLLQQCLSSELAKNLNLLSVIAGRLWSWLDNPQTLLAYFEAVAELDETENLFAPVYADLVQVPELRPHVLAMLRQPEKSPALTQAVGRLFSGQGR